MRPPDRARRIGKHTYGCTHERNRQRHLFLPDRLDQVRPVVADVANGFVDDAGKQVWLRDGIAQLPHFVLVIQAGSASEGGTTSATVRSRSAPQKFWMSRLMKSGDSGSNSSVARYAGR